MAKIKADGVGSATEVAHLLGISNEDVVKFASIGVLARDKARGRYQLQASVKNYCENIRKAATGRASPAVEQRRRMLQAQGDLAETRAAIDAGALLDAGEVESEWSSRCRTTMATMMAVPTRVAARIPNLSRRDTMEIEEVIREKLTAAATYDDEPPGGGDEL
jgi:phage terminase Nu1 subunit (DNA packaging protein)